MRWQERYTDKLLKQYISLLKDESKAPSERFWELDKHMKRTRKHPESGWNWKNRD